MSVFTKNPVAPVHWSNQNLSHTWKGSMNMGYLVPIDCLEMLPNDRIKGNSEAYIQFAPMTYPVMHKIDCKIYHFFVPNRILWKYWQKFIYDGKKDTQPVKPYVTVKGLFDKEWKPNTLSDYLGLPVIQTHVDLSQKIDMLPFLAYQKVWNDYFRDENLQLDIFDDDDEAQLNLFNGVVQQKGEVTAPPLVSMLTSLRKKAWEKDYFTSALPEPQLGDPVPIPVKTEGAKLSKNLSAAVGSYVNPSPYGVNNNEQVMPGLKSPVPANGSWKPLTMGVYTETSDNLNRTEVNGSPVYANLYSGTDITIDGLTFTISDLRLGAAIQRMQEALARGGHRYKEAMITMYNQVTPDYRLDRPEFLAASTIPVVVGAVEQTSSTDDITPQGNLAGRASVFGSNNAFHYHAQEHGFLLTLACVLPRTNYCQGLNRMFTRFDRYDYHNPYFENLGDQEVKNKELFFGEKEYNDAPFGYAPRFSEYKYKPSTIHGDFLNSLDFMTMTRFLGPNPVLNEDFITVDDETTQRPFAVKTDVQHLYCTFYNQVKMRRPMQSNPIPKLI